MIKVLARQAGRFGIAPREAERFVKFLIVGTLGFIVDFGTLAFLVEVVKLPEWVAANSGFSETVGLVLANTISFTAAVVNNFTLNRLWTYPESRRRRKRVQLPQFALVSLFGLAINNGILVLLEPVFKELIPKLAFWPEAIEAYIPAKIVATVVVLFWNFFVNRFWTYKGVNEAAQVGE